MSNGGVGYGLMCPDCSISIDVNVGGNPSLCPKCGKQMIPNQNAKITAKAFCKTCNASFGMINSDKCPKCGEEFA